jgi:hypothetical protein
VLTYDLMKFVSKTTFVSLFISFLHNNEGGGGGKSLFVSALNSDRVDIIEEQDRELQLRGKKPILAPGLPDDDFIDNTRPPRQKCLISVVSYLLGNDIIDQNDVTARELDKDQFECLIDGEFYRLHFDSEVEKSRMLEKFNGGQTTFFYSGLHFDGGLLTTSDINKEPRVNPPPSRPPPSRPPKDIIIEDPTRRRLQTNFNGEKKVLAVRVTDSEGKVHPDDADVISDKIFGSSGDVVNLKSQMSGCSFDKLEISTDYPMFNHKLAAAGVIEVTINVPFAGASSELDIENRAMQAVADKLNINDLPGPFHHIMIVIEKNYFSSGNSGSYLKSYLSGWKSVYYGNLYDNAALQMYGIGRNLGFEDSKGYDDHQTDHTCVMGKPLDAGNSNVEKMCFNPAKNFQSGWYTDKTIIIDNLSCMSPPLNQEVTIVGIADYGNNPQERKVLIKFKDGAHDVIKKHSEDNDNDYFVGFNRAIGINEDNVQADNEVTIIAMDNTSAPSTTKSYLMAHLSEGESYLIDEIGIIVEVLDINLASNPATATISMREDIYDKENLALDERSTACQKNEGSNYYARYAIDGDMSTMSRAYAQRERYWELDLHGIAEIDKIVIWKPRNPATCSYQSCLDDTCSSGCPGNDFANAWLRAFKDEKREVEDRTFDLLIADHVGDKRIRNDCSVTIIPKDTYNGRSSFQARFIQIWQRDNGGTPLDLKEVQVFGTWVRRYSRTRNLALDGEATQSCTHSGADASRAIDGNASPYSAHGSVSHTCCQRRAWWQVRLKTRCTEHISKVVIWNRMDDPVSEISKRLSNSKLILLDKYENVVEKFAIRDTEDVPKLEFLFDPPVMASIVKVKLDGENFLQLAEVEVYGV